MSYGPEETQKAIYQTLSQDATLSTLLGASGSDSRIYDLVPQEKSFPFITMGEVKWLDRGNQTWDGMAAEITIHAWYRSPNQGRKGVQEIQKRIDELLHNSEPIITGWNIVSFRRSTTNIMRDVDNVTLHGIQTFKLMIGEQ